MTAATTSPRTVHVGVLVFPHCIRSAAVVPHDVFALANTLMRTRRGGGGVMFRTHSVSARHGGSIQSGDLRFETVAPDMHPLDALVVPGIEHDGEGVLADRLHELEREQALVRHMAAAGTLLLAGCSAVPLAASAGCLDGRHATTSWWLGAWVRARYPSVQWDLQDMLVSDGNCVSAAGVTSYYDLALWLVSRFGGDDLRRMVGRMLLHDERREHQTPYMSLGSASPGPVVIERARSFLRQRFDKAWTVEALARHCRTSERTLLRRFKEATGASPVQYAQQLRVERAKSLLESTLLSLEEIALRCGYQDASTLHKVFRTWMNITPREYRARFGLRA
jgi:transcriptional regulator GlxA family with amidase domain